MLQNEYWCVACVWCLSAAFAIVNYYRVVLLNTIVN